MIWLQNLPIGLLANGSLHHIHPDHLGTPRAITDQTGTVVWRWDSDPFGTTAANDDPDGDGQRMSFNLRFPGQYYDGETGLHYNYARDYDPRLGSYTESDPIGLEGGYNTYLYAYANPIRYVDMRGLTPDRQDMPKWLPPPYFPDSLGECQAQKREGILKKCMPLTNATEKVACIAAWRDWEMACIGERACRQDVTTVARSD